MTYDLRFDIPSDLFRRAVTQPIDGAAPTGWRREARNLLAAILFPLSLVGVTLAFFDWQALLPVCVGAFVGAGVVLAVWWRQHKTLVRLHKRYNDHAGTQHIVIGPKGIIAKRPHIESRLDWPFVTGIRGIAGATLIELPTARLIVPDAALPDGTSTADFTTQLDEWRAA